MHDKHTNRNLLDVLPLLLLLAFLSCRLALANIFTHCKTIKTLF